DAELRKVWHHFDPLFPLNSSPLLSFFSFIQSPSTPLFLSLFSPVKHHYHGRKVHHPVRWVRVHVRTQRQAVSRQPSFSEPCSGRRGNAYCHDTTGDLSSTWEEDGAEGHRGGKRPTPWFGRTRKEAPRPPLRHGASSRRPLPRGAGEGAQGLRRD